MTAPVLKVEGLQVAYGHIEAVKGISFEVRPGEITALVGANGAGKSTTLLALSGLVKPEAGRVIFEGEDVSRLKPHQRVERGIVQVAEG
ncbi:MAG TPA: ATP-binding cassette domain-containing protein, partial [Methylibium sp.]